MIVFITTAQHAYTVKPLVEGRFGVALPTIRHLSYDALWRADHLPAATYIFTDGERLTAHERRVSAECFRALRDAGMRCLNDPAMLPTRHEFLARLHAAGINPFRSWRADERPCPPRFPVFLRHGAGHDHPLTGLLADQDALDEAVAGLAARGIPLDGVLAVEFCAEPIASGVWRRYGTYRIGDAMHTDHAVTEDAWYVKGGTLGLSTAAMNRHEYDAATDGRYVAAVRPAFVLSGIEFGRADHATVAGREVVFEINTNPTIGGPHPQRVKLREATLALGRARIADALAAIDSGTGVPARVEAGPHTRWWRDRSYACFMAWRP